MIYFLFDTAIIQSYKQSIKITAKFRKDSPMANNKRNGLKTVKTNYEELERKIRDHKIKNAKKNSKNCSYNHCVYLCH